MNQRYRILRKSNSIREMVAETHLRLDDLLFPLFLEEGTGVTEIPSMPGIFRFGIGKIYAELDILLQLGLRFSRWSRWIGKEGEILNDQTNEVLAKMSVLHAHCGADFVAPSDMMDGRIAAIRTALEENGFHKTGIMSYSAKYASSFYGPFRDALDSAPGFGDKKTYQMDYRNRLEAVKESLLDIQEGADMVMVKPAGAYLDIIREVKNAVNVPVAAYQVSGEYSMIKAAAKMGYVHEENAFLETILAIKRAGADIIATYYAKELSKIVKSLVN